MGGGVGSFIDNAARERQISGIVDELEVVEG
jgi:hypothetical protein